MDTRKKARKTISCPKPESFVKVRIGKYKKTRYWGVWLGEELIAATVYKKGALTIKNILRREKATSA